MNRARIIAAAERDAEQNATVPQQHFNAEQVADGVWLALAACRDGVDPELFHPAGRGEAVRKQVADATGHCLGCPVIAACREWRYAIGGTGVFGGVYYERESDRSPQTPRRKCALQRCTTPAAEGSPYCSYECEHRVKVGTITGYALHCREKTPVCKRCAAAKAADVATRRRPAAAVR